MTNSVQRRRHEQQYSRPPRVVFRDENCIRFTGRVNAYAHRQFMWCLHECRKRNYHDVILDFSTCESAFPNGMIPLLSSADSLRRENVDLSVTLPDKDHLRRLFLHANWAHLLEPARHPKSNTVDYRHMAAHRFTNPDDQQQLVNTFMDVVMRNMTLERSVIAGLEWSINEITDNLLNHAECNEGGIVQVSTLKETRKVTFGVADSGRGILSSLREGHPDIQTDWRGSRAQAS